MVKDLAFDQMMELWVSSDSKVSIARFFRKNPGVVDTLEGLAARLAVPADELVFELRDHVELGLLRERRAGDVAVYVLDRRRRDELEERLAQVAASKGDR